MKLYWHEYNPWADSVVYVPAEELAEAIAGGTTYILDENRTVPYDAAFILERWFKRGPVDCYILPQPSGDHSVGARYGKEGSEYFSPYNQNPEKVIALLKKYGGKR